MSNGWTSGSPWRLSHKPFRSVRRRQHDRRMAQNFLPCDRAQTLLLPPDLPEWLPPGHLAWFVIDAVEQLDPSAF
jgi:hypothetical protein